MVALMAGELRRAAPFRDPVEHQNPSLPEELDSQTSAEKVRRGRTSSS